MNGAKIRISLALKAKKVIFAPHREGAISVLEAKKGTNLLWMARLWEKIKKKGVVCTVVPRDDNGEVYTNLLLEVQQKLSEF